MGPISFPSCLTAPVIEEAVDDLQTNENNIVTLPVQYRQSCAASSETAVRYLLQHELHDIITMKY